MARIDPARDWEQGYFFAYPITAERELHKEVWRAGVYMGLNWNRRYPRIQVWNAEHQATITYRFPSRVVPFETLAQAQAYAKERNIINTKFKRRMEHTARWFNAEIVALDVKSYSDESYRKAWIE